MIIYCLDNSSFCQADGDGVITPITKLADNKYQVVGEIIVAHEITMAAAVANLKRILAVCGGRKVFIITPLLRYINDSCCGDLAHCTHKMIPDSATKLLHRFIESWLSSFPLCEVIPAGDLLAAKHGASTSEILAAFSSWGAVHVSGAAYTRMALTLVDKVLSGSFKKPLPPPQAADGGGKRKRTESGSSSGSHRSAASSSRHTGGDLLPVFTRGSSRGGGHGGGHGGSRGSFPAHFSKRGNNSGYDSRYDKNDSRRPGGDRSGTSASGRGGGYASRYSSGSGGGGGNYSRY